MPDRMQHHRMEVHLKHPELKTFIASIPMRFERGEGEVIYKGRNELRRMEYQGYSYVVKSFQRPHLLNRLVYGTLRASKAKRAYYNGLELLQIGVPNPQPIGYVEVSAGLLFDKSFLITAMSHCPYIWKDLFTQDFSYKEQVVREVGKLTALLHNHGIALKDYSRGNILFREESGQVRLELVDLNRMYRGKIDQKRGCKNLERLPATPEMHRWLAEEYALARGYEVEACLSLIQDYRSRQHDLIDGKY